VWRVLLDYAAYGIIGRNLLVSDKYSICILVPSSSHVQIKKSYVNDKDVRNQELLTLDTISPIWAKKLEESKLLPLLSHERLRLSLELKRTSKCVVGEAYGFTSSYVYNCKGCSKISWKFMFYFMIHSYSKLEDTKNEFVKHWGEKHHHTFR
jgi:hypothetical protein